MRERRKPLGIGEQGTVHDRLNVARESRREKWRHSWLAHGRLRATRTLAGEGDTNRNVNQSKAIIQGGRLYTLRFYSPVFSAEDEAAIRALLVRIQSTWNVRYEIVDIPAKPGPFAGHQVTDEKREAELYEQHFVSRAALLKARTGLTIAKALRSNSGYYHVRGAVAVCSMAGVEWHSRGQIQFMTNGKDPAIGSYKLYWRVDQTFSSNFANPCRSGGTPS
jgi:hypothetical protein